MSIHKGQKCLLVCFFPEIASICNKADLRLYWPRKTENSFSCAFSVILAIRINHYTILAHCLKRKFAKFEMCKSQEAKGPELTCHLSGFSCDLIERARHIGVAFAMHMDASETPTTKKWVLSQRGKYNHFLDKLRKQTKQTPDTHLTFSLWALFAV